AAERAAPVHPQAAGEEVAVLPCEQALQEEAARLHLLAPREDEALGRPAERLLAGSRQPAAVAVDPRVRRVDELSADRERGLEVVRRVRFGAAGVVERYLLGLPIPFPDVHRRLDHVPVWL